MYLCDNEFLERLTQSSDERWDLIRPIQKNDIVRLMQISDLHLLPPPSYVKQERQLREYTRLFKEVVGDWKVRFPYHGLGEFAGLIVSGDMVNASGLGYDRSIKDQKEALPDCEIGRNSDKLHKAHEFASLCIGRMAGEISIDVTKSSVLIPGNHDVLLCSPSPLKNVDKTKISSFYDIIHGLACDEDDRGTLASFVHSPRLCLWGEKYKGVVAVFGLDSNHTAYLNPHKNPAHEPHGYVGITQIEQLEKAVSALRAKFDDTPVYVVVVLHHHLLPVESASDDKIEAAQVMASVTLDSPDLIRRLQNMRVSLVTHGHMHQAVIQGVGYTPLRDTDEFQHLNVIGCPSFPRAEGQYRGYFGNLVLTFDLERGSVQVDVCARRGEERQSKSVTLPLTSVSRVSIGEQRLWNRMDAWLKSHGTALANSFADHVRETWDKFRYVPVWKSGLEGVFTPNGSSDELPIKSYRLLLQLWGEDKENPHILLNNHIAVRTSDAGSWDAGVLPAFSSVSEYLSRLKADVARVHEDLRIQDPAKIKDWEKQRNKIVEAIESLRPFDEETLSEAVVEIDTKEFVKFSPTDGRPQRYRYSLCTLTGTPAEDGRSSEIRKQLGAIADALDCLVKVEADVLFRYEPGGAPRAPHGFFWFPLREWKKNPAIVARNADVMEWVQSTLVKLRAHSRKEDRKGDGRSSNNGALPDWLFPRKEAGLFDLDFAMAKKRSFQELEDGIRKVPLQHNEKLMPYEQATIKMVVVRCNGGKDSSGKWKYGTTLVVCQPDGSGGERELGVLRPTQRYVLKQGLVRTRAIRKKLKELLSLDPAKLGTSDCGYLSVPAISETHNIDILPPILEDIPESEWERSGGGAADGQKRREFLVCDGNHRIMEYCWNNDESLNCLLIEHDGKVPAEHRVPYYAYQMTSRDWYVVNQNALAQTPDVIGKYAVRLPSSDDLTRYCLKEEQELSERGRYRIFFRNFSAVFNLGGQAGRVA